ncbi:MAG: hypothetical protein LBG79_07755 [Spirochaetaceae bacterium]|nr:hypothetical protein [Spirochaetaceae bacterium]
MRLLLLGETKNSGSGDPYPVIVPGLAKPVNSTKVEDYVNNEFWFYYEFYISCKHAGQPWACGWLDWPPWSVQLTTAFDIIIEGEKARNDRQFQAALHGARI